mgnify:CR=1 FL=1
MKIYLKLIFQISMKELRNKLLRGLENNFQCKVYNLEYIMKEIIQLTEL